jgi:hypothetical protein
MLVTFGEGQWLRNFLLYRHFELRLLLPYLSKLFLTILFSKAFIQFPFEEKTFAPIQNEKQYYITLFRL